MRKQLLALMSALGLAGSAAPGTAQVIKGKDSSATQAETQQKSNQSDKGVLIGMTKADTKQKKRKAGGEQKALGLEDKRKRGIAESSASRDAKNDKWRKVSSENDAARKQQTIMLTNGQMGDGSVSKTSKARGETNSVRSDTLVKSGKAAADSSAAQSEAAKKANQATPK